MPEFPQSSKGPPAESSECYTTYSTSSRGGDAGDGESEQQEKTEGPCLISRRLEKIKFELEPTSQTFPSVFLPISPGIGSEQSHLSERSEAAFLIAFGLYHANEANRTIMRYYNFISGVGIGAGGQASVVRLEKNHTLQPYEKVQSSLPRYIAYRCLNNIAEAESSPCDEPLRDLAAEIILMRCLEERPDLNIVKILSVEWVGHTETFWLEGLPAVLYEYSEHGSLVDFLKNSNLGEQGLDFSIKRKLCRDFVSGIHALHLLGISHGDVKYIPIPNLLNSLTHVNRPDNILIFGNPAEGYIAKISDFGSISIQHCNRSRAWHNIWGAPGKISSYELKRSLKIAKAQDLYSLGLSIWSTFLDGCNPFYHRKVSNLIYQQFGIQNAYLESVESLKLAANDRLLDIVSLSFKKDSPKSHAIQMLEAIRSLCRLDADARDILKALKYLNVGEAVSSLDCKPMTLQWSNQCFSAFSVQVRQLPVPKNPAETYFEIDAAVIRDSSPSPSWITLLHVSTSEILPDIG